ncbi:uncharacterized protein METZ01_LOCUS219003, partial [marine metagenome]
FKSPVCLDMVRLSYNIYGYSGKVRGYRPNTSRLH